MDDPGLTRNVYAPGANGSRIRSKGEGMNRHTFLVGASAVSLAAILSAQGDRPQGVTYKSPGGTTLRLMPFSFAPATIIAVGLSPKRLKSVQSVAPKKR